MPIAAIKEYIRRLPALRAEAELEMIEAAAMPYMQKSKSKAITERLESLIKEKYNIKPKKATPPLLRRLGINFVKVKAKS